MEGKQKHVGLYTLNTKRRENRKKNFTQAVTYETTTTFTTAGRDERSKGTLSERDERTFVSSLLFSFLVFFFEKREREKGKSQFSFCCCFPAGNFLMVLF